MRTWMKRSAKGLRRSYAARTLRDKSGTVVVLQRGLLAARNLSSGSTVPSAVGWSSSKGPVRSSLPTSASSSSGNNWASTCHCQMEREQPIFSALSWITMAAGLIGSGEGKELARGNSRGGL